MELKKRGIVRALVVGGALATGWAFNSTDAMAAEVGTEPEVTVENTDAQEEQSQEEIVEKMEDAVGVVEGDAVAEEGYLEQAQEAIANNDLSNEAADELVSNGQQVLEQAQEKNEVVKNELEKVEAATEEAKAEFEETAKESGDEWYAEWVSKGALIQDKISQLEKVLEKTEAYNTDYEECLEKYNNTKAEYITLLHKCADLRERSNSGQLWKEYEELCAKEEELKAALDAIAVEYCPIEMELDEYSTELWHLKDAIKADKAEAELAEQEITQHEEDIKEYTAQAEETSKRMEEIQAKLESETDSSVREELEGQYSEAENEYDVCMNNIALSNQGLEASQNKYDKATKAQAEHQEQYETKSRELEDLKIKYKDIIDAYDDANAAYEDVKYDTWYYSWFLISGVRLDQLEEELGDKRVKFENCKYKLQQAEVKKAFVEATANYKAALEREVEAQALVERSETALEKATATYDELTKVVEEYKASHVVEPEEPEVTEVTTEKSFTTNISQKVRDIFTGFTVAIEATITTTVTEVAKTVTNAVTQAKETVTTTKVNVAGNAVVKIYDRLGKLVTTLKDAGSFSLGWIGGFFRF